MNLLFVTLGSLGDVKPMVAIAAFAKGAGHQVRFATSPGYRGLVEEAGLRYEAFGSDAFFKSKKVRDAMVDPRTGFGVFMRHANLMALEDLYERLTVIASGADVLVATPLVMAAHLVAKKGKLTFVSCALSPAMILKEASAGAIDPHQHEWRSRLNALRQKVGLPGRSFPQMERFSADLTLGVYPSCLRPSSGHYISAPLEIGYPHLRMPLAPLGRELAEWIEKGTFALVSFGSFVDWDAENCFRSAVEACRRVGLRCLYVSKHSADHLTLSRSRDVRVERFVEHSQVMINAAAIVHHGGTGTLVESIRALRPIVVTPFGLDQPYNASCVHERDLGEVLDASLINPSALARALSSAIDTWPRRAALALRAIGSSEDRPEEMALREIEQVLTRQRGQIGRAWTAGLLKEQHGASPSD